MLINKKVGNWCENEESDDLDDIAYQLYLNYYYNEYRSYSQAKQYMFMTIRNNYSYTLNRFYKKACNILRKEKIEKITNEHRF